MQPFYHPVGLRVVGRGGVMCNAHLRAESRPGSRRKLRTAVSCHILRDAVPSNPVEKEGPDAGIGLDVLEWHHLGPARKSVDHREHVRVPAGRRKRSHEVHIHMRQSTTRRFERLQRSLDVPGHLGRLAGVALLAPEANVLPHAMPDKTGRQSTSGRASSNVGEVVDGREDAPPPG